jgi:hypothetical protein
MNNYHLSLHLYFSKKKEKKLIIFTIIDINKLIIMLQPAASKSSFTVKMSPLAFGLSAAYKRIIKISYKM